MPGIIVLDQETVNQIAAGEVVERPSSVVKELTENALDAGAGVITIEIRDGGVSLIRVTDNGCGIPSEEVRTAFLPHATSKIRQADDLASIGTLGFRGEALASIAAVSRVELITRTKESLTGIRYVSEGGAETVLEEVGAPEGTTFLVRDLFFNTPARRNFLKSAATEGSYITSLIERLSLSHPEVSFRLIVNQQTRLHTSGNGRVRDIIYHIYGREIARALIPLRYEADGIRVSGFIGKPEINRGNRTYETYFVNGRYIKSPVLTKAIENAYRGYVMQQKYPFAVFHLQLDAERIDVNVHPNKMELRFRDEEAVYETVNRGIREALHTEELIPAHSFSQRTAVPRIPEERKPEPFETNREQALRREKQEDLPLLRETPASPQGASGSSQEISGLSHEVHVSSHEGSGPSLLESILSEESKAAPQKAAAAPQKEDSGETAPKSIETAPPEESVKKPDSESAKPEREIPQEPSKPVQRDLFTERLLTPETRAEYRVIGQLFDTYWLIQYRDQLLIMDQHAAHEKVLFERNTAAFDRKEFTSQELRPPKILTLTGAQIQAIQDNRQIFEEIGFHLEPFGGREYAVYALPANLLGLDAGEVLTDMIDVLSDEAGHSESSLIRDRLALMSCKAAVKGNQRLSMQEIQALLDELLTLKNPYLCPHGRPTIITMSRYELEKKFKRVVS